MRASNSALSRCVSLFGPLLAQNNLIISFNHAILVLAMWSPTSNVDLEFFVKGNHLSNKTKHFELQDPTTFATT